MAENIYTLIAKKIKEIVEKKAEKTEVESLGKRLEAIEARPHLEETEDGHVAVVIPE